MPRKILVDTIDSERRSAGSSRADGAGKLIDLLVEQEAEAKAMGRLLVVSVDVGTTPTDPIVVDCRLSTIKWKTG